MRDVRFTAKPDDAGKRLDAFLSAQLCDGAMTRSYLQKLIEQGNVTVNAVVESKHYKMCGGDEIAAQIPEPQEIVAQPQALPLDIIFEDEWIIIVNKQRGMVVHPAPGNSDGTLVNALLFHCAGTLSDVNGALRPGIVHRIDKDTSGLLVIAKNNAAHLALANQIENHSMIRQYIAVVHGRVKEDSGTIDRPIGRDPRDRKKFCVTAVNAKPAITHYEVQERFDRYTCLACKLETGRTHQIRVHMAYFRHPVAGDRVYGPKNTPDLGGQCLHAGTLGFVHPYTGEYIEFNAPLPGYFFSFLNGLRGGKDGETHRFIGSI